jgi:hypothetical protein
MTANLMRAHNSQIIVGSQLRKPAAGRFEVVVPEGAQRPSFNTAVGFEGFNFTRAARR